MHEELVYNFNTPRAKALSFHPTKPVLLSSHHTSHILLHDLHLNTLIYTFHGHEGPVRALLFHPRTDLFISGGDDTKIILWSCVSRKQLHTFKGHTDYIRSLHFHPVHPWFLSTSDDQTIKIWNFQSYKLLSTISGHSHYVMCAKFVNDVIMSVSLDQTIRVWDYSGLISKKETNILGVPNVFVKQIIDAHDRGINWIEKHPTMNVVVTAGDDRQVKVWEAGDTVWEKECHFNHSGNVTSVCFVGNFVLSCGEDGILGIEGKGYSRKIVEDTRNWCITSNFDGSLFAVGNDTGIKIYSTTRRGVVYAVDGESVYYVNEDKVVRNNLESELMVAKPRKEVLNIVNGSGTILIQYLNLFDVFKDKKLIAKGTGYGILMPRNDLNSKELEENKMSNNNSLSDKKTTVNNSVLNEKVLSIERNEITFDGEFIKEVENDTRTDIKLQKYDEDSFFIIKKTSIELFDLNKRKTIAQLKINDTKFIIKGINRIAIICTRRIYILDNNFNTLSIFDEMVEINGAFFDEDSLFYSTMRHIKYIIGDSKGILRSLEKEAFLIFKKNDLFFYLTKEGLENVKIDLIEYNFKKAVIENNKDEISTIIKSARIPGTSIYDYLIKKGKGETILEHFKGKNNKKKLEILIEVGRLNECYNLIKGNNEMYHKLFIKSMSLENVVIAEKCLWKLKDYYGLFMLFICMNKKERMKELLRFGDDSFKVNIGIFLGDTEIVRKYLFKKDLIQNDISNETEDYYVESDNTSNGVNEIDTCNEVSNKFNASNNVITGGNIIGTNNYNLSKISNEIKKDDVLDTGNNIQGEEILGKKIDSLTINNLNENNNSSYIEHLKTSKDSDEVSFESKEIEDYKDTKEVTNEFNNKDRKRKDLNNYDESNNIYNEYNNMNNEYNDSTIKEHNNNINNESKNNKYREYIDSTIKEYNDLKIIDKNKINKDDLNRENSARNKSSEEFYDNNLYLEKESFINKQINFSECYDKSMELITEGKFTNAINNLKEILYTLIHYKNNNDFNDDKFNFDNVNLRRDLGMYLSGLIVEKKKKKLCDSLVLLNIGKYFSSLNLQENHKILASSNFMILCYKNENYSMAKEIANELKGKVEGNLGKMTGKILKSNKEGVKYKIKKGTFCFDTNEFSNKFVTCRLCFVTSFEGKICTCCEIGILE